MKLDKFLDKTYYCTPLKIIEYGTGDILFQNVTPINFNRGGLKKWSENVEVMSYGMGINDELEKVFEIEIEWED